MADGTVLFNSNSLETDTCTINYYYNPPLKMPPPLQWKSGLLRGWSLERDNLVVFYFPNASEIWPDKRGGIWWVWSYKRETTAYAGGWLPFINVTTQLNFFKSGLVIHGTKIFDIVKKKIKSYFFFDLHIGYCKSNMKVLGTGMSSTR